MGKIILWILSALLGLCLLYVLFLTVCALLVDTKKEYEHDSPFYRRLLYGATACCIRLLHIHIHVDGMEKLPKDGRFLLVCNHRSNFDPILTWQVMKERNLAFVSKAENFQIPIFGRIIRRCCFMAIDRENPRNALLTIDKAAKLIESDEVSIGIYPEGTRSKECVLLPFHNGVFKIAQKANVPIVVCTIRNTRQIFRNVTHLKPTDVELHLVDVIPAENLKGKTTVDIGNQVYEMMIGDLGESFRAEEA